MTRLPHRHYVAVLVLAIALGYLLSRGIVGLLSAWAERDIDVANSDFQGRLKPIEKGAHGRLGAVTAYPYRAAPGGDRAI